MNKIIAVLLFSLLTTFSYAQSVFGKWQTVDDETGEKKSIVEIYQKDGKVFGKIVKLFREPNEDQDPVCTKCTDDRKGKKIIGMDIIRNMEKDGDEYEDGTVIDPENGKVYDCKIWVEDGNLKMRGYIAFLYRTQTWLPYKD